MGNEYPRDLPATHVTHMRPGMQALTPASLPPEFGQVYVLLPVRVISDRRFGSLVRVLAWLISHGATTKNTVKISQEALAHELDLARYTVQRTLLGLARAGYIEIVIDPESGRHSYRLAFTLEGGK